MEPQAIHISDAELTSDVRAMLKRAETGAEIIIERDGQAIAALRPAIPPRRTVSECIAMLPDDSTATIDRDFARDVDVAIEAIAGVDISNRRG